MRLLDSRRLTGPNVIWKRPGAVIDVAFGEVNPQLVIGAWQQAVRRLLDEVGWCSEHYCVRRFAGGASLAISAPVDALYTATEINDSAWDAACDLVEGGQRQLLQRVSRTLRDEICEEERPRLQCLLAAAAERGVPAVLDTEEVSLGLGCHSRCWALADVPHPDDVNWTALGAIPVALVTGTNGKTTTVRMMLAIARAAGKMPGVSSTDWLQVGEEILERDDYSGPQGARIILRNAQCDMAILETARGGLLRRGLAVDHADAALITNVAADHLGEFGVTDLQELADVKWVVSRALGPAGTLVLNADDPLLLQRAPSSEASILWFSPDPANPVLKQHVAAGGSGCTLNRGRIVLLQGDQMTPVAPVKRIPLCMGGAARHNICNALGAAGLAHALGIPAAAIGQGLCAMTLEDNPGRANLFQVGGATVLLDFAHNPHGVAAVIDMAAQLPAQRRLLIIGQAGDRSDDDIYQLGTATRELRFDRVLIKRQDLHCRGREVGEVAAILKRAFRELGYNARQLSLLVSELGALRAALRWAEEGDLIVFLAHEDKEAARQLLSSLQSAKS